jgi:acyl carrier protein
VQPDATPDALATRIRAIVAERLGVEPATLTLDADLEDDLAADAFDRAELADAFEEAFAIVVRDEEVAPLRTLGELAGYVAARLGDTRALLSP